MKKRGFTLIELLAAMTIMVILVIIVSSMIASATRTWDAGQNDIAAGDAGKTVLDMLWRDANGAMVNEYLPLLVIYDEYNTAPYLGINSALFFVSNVLKRDSQDNKKDWREIAYFIILDTDGRGALVRYPGSSGSTMASFMGSDGALRDQLRIEGVIDTQRSTKDDVEVLAQNVYSFEVDPAGYASYYTKDFNNALPAFIDVKLMILNDDAWKRRGWMSEAEFDVYAQENAKVYSARLSILQHNNSQ